MLWDDGTVQDPPSKTVVVFEYVMLALMVAEAGATTALMSPEALPPTVPLQVVPAEGSLRTGRRPAWLGPRQISRMRPRWSTRGLMGSTVGVVVRRLGYGCREGCGRGQRGESQRAHRAG